MKFAYPWWVGVWVLVCLTGCTTLRNERRIRTARENADVENMRTDLRRLQSCVEGLEGKLQRLEEDVQSARTASGRNHQELIGRVVAMEQAVKAIDLSRESDKKEILKFMQSLTTGPGSKPVEGGYEHVVQAGETLSQIATAYKTRVDVIVKANNLKNSNSIRIGQKLFIPEPGLSR